MSEYKSRAERTTHSEHFDWVEEIQGGAWSGLRNARTMFRINEAHSSQGEVFLLYCQFTGVLTLSAEHDSMQKAQEAADRYFEDWAHALGLKVSEQWWKESHG